MIFHFSFLSEFSKKIIMTRNQKSGQRETYSWKYSSLENIMSLSFNVFEFLKIVKTIPVCSLSKSIIFLGQIFALIAYEKEEGMKVCWYYVYPLFRREIHIINVQVSRVQRYDQCGELLAGADIKPGATKTIFRKVFFCDLLYISLTAKISNQLLFSRLTYYLI